MKILYVSTMGDMMKFFEEHFKTLLAAGHEIELACNDTILPVPPQIRKLGLKINHIDFSRNPVSKNNIKAKKQLRGLLKENNYDIVHTHSPNASAIVRMVCRPLRKNGLKVYYTAHGFHFFEGASKKNWAIFYPVEKYLSKFTDVLITINHEDYIRAKNKFSANQVMYIPGVGLDVDKIKNISIDTDIKRQEMGISETDIVLLSVGELNENKNHKIIIEALGKMRNKNIKYLIAGIGPKEEELKQLIREYDLESNITLLGHRNDIYELCKMSDVFVFPSLREGLSVALMESICCDLPIICSDIRGNNDLIKNGENGFLVNNHSDEYIEKINFIINNPNFKEQAIEYNEKIINNIDSKNINDIIRDIY